MGELARARIVVSLYFDEDHSPTDTNVKECLEWGTVIDIDEKYMIQAIEELTGIIIKE